MVPEHMLLCNTMQTPLKHDNYKLSQQCEIYYLLFVHYAIACSAICLQHGSMWVCAKLFLVELSLLANTCCRGHLGGLLGGALATCILGPCYNKQHVVSPFAGDLSCYNHLPPMTKVYEDSPPLELLKRDLILPNSWAHEHFLEIKKKNSKPYNMHCVTCTWLALLEKALLN